MKAKHMLAALLAAATLSAALPSALAAGGHDQPATRGAVCAALLAAADDYNPGVTASDIMQGGPDGDLRENDPVTRAEALVMLQRAFGGLPAPKGDSARMAYPASQFTDIPAWAQSELADVFAAGIVAGTDASTFSPDQTVTMRQLDCFIRRTFALFGSNEKDDFYAAVNKEWLDNSTLRPGVTSSGTMYDLIWDTEPLSRLIRQAARSPETEDEKRIAALYTNALDWEARNAAGIAPLQPYLDAIAQAQTLDALMTVRNRIRDELGHDHLLGFSLTADAKDSTRYAVTFSTFTPSMSKEIYAADGGSQKDAYLEYIQTVLQIAGADEAAARADAGRLWAIEKAVSPSRLDFQERVDVDKTYNVFTMAELKALLPGVDLDAVYAGSGFSADDHILVSDTGLLRATAPYFTRAHLDDLKLLLRIQLLIGYGSFLSRDFSDASDAFSQAFLGVDGSVSDEENATSAVQNLLSDELGRLYAAEYFSPEAKADVEDMVHDFLAIYRDKIKNLSWMSEATKTKALEKLDTMRVKVGYPDEGDWNGTLDGVTLKTAAEGGSYFSNAVAIAKARRAQQAVQQRRPVDKGKWELSAYTVNACYVPTSNEICFPAGILQPPVYDVNASREENLGGIGYVIAHEITHAFDNDGAKYDKNGNAADWWTPEDYAAFQELCESVVAYYDGRESAPGITCNGRQTLSENIADLGAASCILQAAQLEEQPDLVAMFRAMARIWASTATRDSVLYMSQIDLHAPDKLRGTLPLQSLDAFYEVFGITEGDGMWIAPEDRVSVW